VSQSTTTIVIPERPLFDEARLAIAGFLARYSGSTRATYAADLRYFFAWCAECRLNAFEAKRGHLELWARMMEESGLARSTIGRRISTVAGFYRFAVIDGIIEHSPAEYVRRPKIDTESTTLGLDRMDLGAFIAQGQAAGPIDHALACLLGLLGLRVSKACDINIEHLSIERGHRTVTVLGKGAKLAVIPLPPRVGRAVDQAAGEREAGPLLLTRSGRRMNRHAATRIVRRWPTEPGSPSTSVPTRCATASSPPPSTPASPGRADRGPPRRSPDHHPLRPGSQQPRSARQLHRDGLRGRPQLSYPHHWFRHYRAPRTSSGGQVASAQRLAR
jgi:site-specific recombinase XerD